MAAAVEHSKGLTVLTPRQHVAAILAAGLISARTAPSRVYDANVDSDPFIQGTVELRIRAFALADWLLAEPE